MDWCGFSVIPAALDMRTYVEVEAGTPGTSEIYSYPPFSRHESHDPGAGGINPASDLRYARATLIALERDGVRTSGMRIRFLRAEEVEGLKGPGRKGALIDLPVKKGLSSSAAVCVAVAAGVDIIASGAAKASGSAFTAEEMGRYADLAYRAEREILGVNCGQMDQYAASFGGLLYVDCSTSPAKVKPLSPQTELPMVIGDTMQVKDTPRILAWLGKRFREKEVGFMEGVRNIVRIVEAAREELERSSPSRARIGELMNENQYYLERYLKVSGSCPVSPSNLDKLVRAANDAGALGAKLSGSGGGGAMVALSEPGDLEGVADAIRRAGGEAYATEVAARGLEIEVAG